MFPTASKVQIDMETNPHPIKNSHLDSLFDKLLPEAQALTTKDLLLKGRLGWASLFGKFCLSFNSVHELFLILKKVLQAMVPFVYCLQV